MVIQTIEVPVMNGRRWHDQFSGAIIGEFRESSLQRGLISYLKVVEVEVDSNAWNAGIREGDILYSINKQRIHNHEEALEVIDSSEQGMILNIQRNNRELYLLIR